MNLEPSGRITHAEETRITFNCSVNIPGLYPKWTINNQVYEITYLPPGFEATQSTLSFTFEWIAKVSCFYTILLDGEIVDVCSDVTTVIPLNTRGELCVILLQNPRDVHKPTEKNKYGTSISLTGMATLHSGAMVPPSIYPSLRLICCITYALCVSLTVIDLLHYLCFVYIYIYIYIYIIYIIIFTHAKIIVLQAIPSHRGRGYGL